MENMIKHDKTNNIHSIFDIKQILTNNMMRMELFLSSSHWKKLRSYVTPLERKQYDNALKQFSIENRFSNRNYEHFAVFWQLSNRKAHNNEGLSYRPETYKAMSVTLDSKMIF